MVRALKNQPIDVPAQRIRLAELTVDSDVAANADNTGLLIAAAQDAIALTNITLGERLARAASNRGGGLVASELLARALLWQGKADEAEETLSAFDADSMSELDLVRWGSARIANLQWSMGDAEASDTVLQMLRDRITHRGLRLVVDGIASASLLFENQLDEAEGFSKHVLSEAESSPTAVAWAVFGGCLALALRGRADEVAVIARRGHEVERDVDGLLRYLTAFGEVRALTIAGEFDSAEKRSADIVRISSPGQYLAWGMANVLAGTVEVARGRFSETAARMEQTVAALTSESAASSSFHSPTVADTGLLRIGSRPAWRRDGGRTAHPPGPPCRGVRAAATNHRGVAGRCRRQCQCRGGIFAGCGALGQRVGTGRDRDACPARREPVRRSRLTSSPRVEECQHVDGQLSEAIAAHAEALMAHDAMAIYAAAQRFEQLGALLSAADSAAQAVIAFEAAGNRRAAVEVAAMANRLAAECGGIRTPALTLSAHPPPAEYSRT